MYRPKAVTPIAVAQQQHQQPIVLGTIVDGSHPLPPLQQETGGVASSFLGMADPINELQNAIAAAPNVPNEMDALNRARLRIHVALVGVQDLPHMEQLIGEARAAMLILFQPATRPDWRRKRAAVAVGGYIKRMKTHLSSVGTDALKAVMISVST